MQYVQGDILTPEGFIPGYLNISQSGEGCEIHTGTPPKKPEVNGLIIPKFVNAHTHIGDSFIRKKQLELPRSVKDLVAPPDGVKYQLFKEASEQEILEGIQTSLGEMDTSGTTWFCDFREAGLIGVFQLRKAMKHHRVNAMILSRPSQMIYNKEEIDMLLQSTQGIGLSSISDWEPAEIEKIAAHVRRKRKIFALHGSEALREDIEFLLQLHPRFLVHMIAASRADLERVSDAHIPIVVCPRSYRFFHLKTNYDLMKQTKVIMLLGTDNGMINSPDVGEDVRLLRHSGLFSDEELLSMVTYSPRKALNLDDGIQGGNPLRHFAVLERESLKPIYVSQ
jgi:cytosine/adenosine deaminase-related metal-dependent hydrolase